jgi:ribulose-phosphate 3-epimerase
MTSISQPRKNSKPNNDKKLSAFEILKGSAPTISVSILAADLMNLGSAVELIEAEGVPMIHFDVMDGCFCPAMTVGPPFIKGIKTKLLKDVHLMICDPLTKVANYVEAGADIVTVHVESCPAHIHRIFQELSELTNANDPVRGIVKGVALNPGTPVELIKPIIEMVDMVTLLAVNPGWGRQHFLESTKRKVGEIKEMAKELSKDVLICVDGGVTKSNIADIGQTGIDVVVTGSAVFEGSDPAHNIRLMQEALRAKEIYSA